MDCLPDHLRRRTRCWTAYSYSGCLKKLKPGTDSYRDVDDHVLRSLVPQYAPSANPQGAIIDSGASGFRNVVSSGDLAGVLLTAYALSVDRVSYTSPPLLASAASLFSWVWNGKASERKK